MPSTTDGGRSVDDEPSLERFDADSVDETSYSVLLLVEHCRNRALLSEWFATQPGCDCIDGLAHLARATDRQPNQTGSDASDDDDRPDEYRSVGERDGPTRAETVTDGHASASDPLLDDAHAPLDRLSVDLILVDVTGFDAHAEWLEARVGIEQPLPLPCLLLATEPTAARFFAPKEGHQWNHLVDDVLITPIDSTLLDRRVQAYLKLRLQATELDRRHDQLSLLAQVVRHDIANAATVVTGWGEILRGQLHGDDFSALERVLRAGQRIVEIVENSRDLTMLIDAGHEPETKAMALAPVLRSEVDAISRLHESATKTVRVDFESSPPSVRVLAGGMLSSVFANLLSNAVRHNESDVAEITVSVDVKPTEVIVRVADNGPGIPDEEKEHVFKPATKRGGSPGDGLGLSLVKRLVDSYDGHVWFEDAPGGGAVACVSLHRPPS